MPCWRGGEVRRGRRIGCRAEGLVGAQAGFGGVDRWMVGAMTEGEGCLICSFSQYFLLCKS